MADDKRRKDEERGEEEQRWIDRMLDPFGGPASENAYPEDPENDPDGSGKIMNGFSRTYNRIFGEVDEAADKPWTPESTRPLKGSAPRWTDEQLAEHSALQAKLDALDERFEQSKLKSTSQLPDLEGEDLDIIWDFEETGEGEDDWTVLRHGDREIWREIGLKEAIPRFDGVLWILREKYGSRLASLRPTTAVLHQLRTLGFVTKPAVDELNEELQDKRGPLEPKGTIEVEDADTDKPDLQRQAEELMASVRKMGRIDCPCGWVGDATEARIIGTSSPLELSCPEGQFQSCASGNLWRRIRDDCPSDCPFRGALFSRADRDHNR